MDWQVTWLAERGHRILETMSPKPDSFRPAKIVSGGQTGVDRAALDAAMELAIPHGGWCPRGRRAEDGVIPRRYQLEETASNDYAVRTVRNVLDSDATLILFRSPLAGGTELTFRIAQQHGKPCLLVDLDHPPATSEIRMWLAENRPATLNVAGPRESQKPGVTAQSKRLLLELFRGADPDPEG